MKRLALVLLLAGPALGQIAVTSAPCKMTDGSCAAASPLTTKGDVFGFSSVAARIPIGTNGQVLTADSTQTLGLKWAAVSATGDVEAVNITASSPLTGSANCASGTCAFTLGLTGGTVSGLTANTIPKATSATAIGNSSVTDDGTTLTLSGQVKVTEATGVTKWQGTGHANNYVTVDGDNGKITMSTNGGGSHTIEPHAGSGLKFDNGSNGYILGGVFTGSGISNGTGSAQVTLDDGYGPRIKSSIPGSTNSTILACAGNNVLMLGMYDGTPDPQTFIASPNARGGTDTNTAGANAAIYPGLGTGTAASGDLKVQSGYAGSTGTTQNTATDRVHIESAWTTLTDASATNLASLTFAASKAIGAELLVTVEANDGTEYQSLTSRVRVSSVRKAAGNTVSGINVVGTDLAAVSSGTLTCTFTVVEGAAAATVQANCDSSLTTPTVRASFIGMANGPVTIAGL